MQRIKKTYDVFLSYSAELSGEAKVIIDKFAHEGLSVFDILAIKPGYSIAEETWQALAESWAVVGLIREGRVPASLAVEIGAASAWQKPIYIVTEGEGEYALPLYLTLSLS